MIRGNLKYRVDPDHANAAYAQNGGNHWCERGSESTERAGGNIHQTAQEVGKCYEVKPDQATCNSLCRVGDIDGQKLLTEEPDRNTGNDTEKCHISNTCNKNLFDAVIFVSTHVLAGVVDSSLLKTVHDHIYKTLNIACRAVSGNDSIGTERVDGGLNDHIGNGEQRALDTGRQANTNDFQKGFFRK